MASNRLCERVRTVAFTSGMIAVSRCRNAITGAVDRLDPEVWRYPDVWCDSAARCGLTSSRCHPSPTGCIACEATIWSTARVASLSVSRITQATACPRVASPDRTAGTRSPRGSTDWRHQSPAERPRKTEGHHQRSASRPRSQSAKRQKTSSASSANRTALATDAPGSLAGRTARRVKTARSLRTASANRSASAPSSRNRAAGAIRRTISSACAAKPKADPARPANAASNRWRARSPSAALCSLTARNCTESGASKGSIGSFAVKVCLAA
jgi:hypothetical protein